MHPIPFIAGALLGAAGLACAAIYDERRTEGQYSPLLKTPENLTADEVEELLNKYYFQAQQIFAKLNDTEMDSIDLMSVPLELPDDDLAQKAMNFIGGCATRISRSACVMKLKGIREDILKLYGRYSGVFRRANAIIKSRGRTGVELIGAEGIKMFALNNSLANEDWQDEFEVHVDKIRDYIEKTCSNVEDLIELLNQKDAIASIQCAARS